MSSTGKPYYVYMITSGSRTYCGYTIDLKRRLRQHCGELVGGAKATRCSSNWRYFCIVTCADWCAVDAMRFEWLSKHPTRKRRFPPQFRGPQGRLLSLQEVCKRTHHTASALCVHVGSEDLQSVQERLKCFEPRVIVQTLDCLVQMSDMTDKNHDHTPSRAAAQDTLLLQYRHSPLLSCPSPTASPAGVRADRPQPSLPTELHTQTGGAHFPRH